MLAVTGASGFVGGALCREAARRGRRVVAITRSGQACPGAIEARAMGEMGTDPVNASLFAGVECVVHCAGMVHVMHAHAATDLAAFRRVNRDGTLALARAAASAGVRRFLFLSTAKVLGEQSGNRPFRHDDPLAPTDAYSTSKAETERALREFATQTAMDLVIVRPPLVHGPGAGGNLAVLVRLIRRRTPLPLGSIANRRAVLGLENLVDALLYLTEAPTAAGETVLLRDEPSLSTPDIVRALAEGLGVRPLLFPFPTSLLRAMAQLTGRQAHAMRLLESLDLSLERTTGVIGWSPRVEAKEGLRRVARGSTAP